MKANGDSYFELGFAATSVNTTGSADGPSLALRPAGIVLIQKVGILRTEGELDNLTLDASVVNPKPSVQARRSVKKTAK